MSGRGGGGRGRGAWRGRGRGAPGAPAAKDEEGNVIDSQPAGPPPLFPEIELPAHQEEVPPRDQMLLIRRNELIAAAKRSPFFIEAKADSAESVDDLMQQYKQYKVGVHDAPASNKAVAGPAQPRKRAREPLTSVIKLLPEYFPEELYTSSDRRYAARLQDSYFKRAARKDDVGLHRLDALAQLEGAAAAAAGGGAGAEGPDAGEGEGEGEPEVVDEDDEEDMNEDDYYQGAEFDDDEEYDAGFDDGGDDGAFF